MSHPSPYIAMLRGINVGGHNRLPMADLRQMMADLGCTSVETYIQSGNVVYHAGPDLADGFETRLSNEIQSRMGLTVPVIIRTPGELRRVIAENPFADQPFTDKTLHVAFLDTLPTADGLESLDPDRSPGDVFHVAGKEVYIFYPNGAGRSKLTPDYFERRLKVRSTMRNWRTVLTLADMSQSE